MVKVSKTSSTHFYISLVQHLTKMIALSGFDEKDVLGL